MADLATQLGDKNPQSYINDANIEMAWAIKASEMASIHMNLLLSVQPTKLKLNRHQDDVYKRFREVFPEMNVEIVTERELKGDNKEKWRLFCEEYKEIVDDYNFGTMLRMHANGIYDDENTIITQKIIYLAIEGARNIEGVNEKCKETFKEKYRNAHESGATNVL